MSIVNLFQLSPPTVLIALIFFIMKFYLLFRINFLYLKVIFRWFRVNLSRVNFQYLNFMER